MKLQELGLSTKPQTKYFEGGFVSFSTFEEELYYEVEHRIKNSSTTYSKGIVEGGKVLKKEYFDMLMNIKTIQEFLQV